MIVLVKRGNKKRQLEIQEAKFAQKSNRLISENGALDNIMNISGRPGMSGACRFHPALRKITGVSMRVRKRDR